jgi:glycosyltransferase involved in cell wall biosynthesis
MGSLRVVIQQAALPQFRVPFFRALAARPGIELSVFYSDSPHLQNAEPEGFRAYKAPLRSFHVGSQGPLRWHGEALRVSAAAAADVLVTEWSTRYLSLPPSAALAHARGVGVVMWGHGLSPRERPGGLWLRQSYGRLADAVVLYNRRAADRYRALGFPAERLFVAPNTLDQDPIRRARETWSEERLREFQVKQGLGNRKLILFVARLLPERRLDRLLQALAMMQRPDLLLVIIGDGPERTVLRQLTHGLGLGENVRFLSALYAEEQLAPWFLSARFMCFPAHIGLSLIHAFAYGCPVVAGADRSGPEFETLRHGENGLAIPSIDPPALARTLMTALDDEASLRRWGENAQRLVRCEYSLAQMVDGMQAAIECAARCGGGHRSRRRLRPALQLSASAGEGSRLHRRGLSG